MIALLSLLLAPAGLAEAKNDQGFTIRDLRVRKSSGLARDVDARLYWTVNDSGAEGTVYGLDPEGNVQGILGFRAKPEDVEAVAMHDRRLYVADIGDHKRQRRMITVYYFDRPRPDNRTVPYRAYDFSYPDGPHDAETLLVDRRGRLYVVTKERKGGIYVAPRRPSRSGVNQLRRVADAPAYVTDGVFLPKDNRIALRTYVSVLVLDGRSYRTVARAATPWQKRGESIAVGLTGSSLLLGSEGARSAVLQVPVPNRLASVPVAGNAPPASPRPTPSASESAAPDEPADTADEDPGTPVSRTGTLLALTLAAFVALVAGVVVAAHRR
jgi:hypothetical protein